MKILITGSEGRIGKILSSALKEHELILVDRKETAPIQLNLLNLEQAVSYFSNVDSVIHLAGHPEPWATQQQGLENVRLTKNVYEAIRLNNVERVVYSSSINVYPYRNIFNSGSKINERTELSPSAWEGRSFYAKSKISCERIGEIYYRKYGISVLNLRLGLVTEDNKPYDTPVDRAVWLSYRDLIEIVRRGLNFEGFANLVCTSDNGFVDLSDMKKTLNYLPQDSSSIL